MSDLYLVKYPSGSSSSFRTFENALAYSAFLRARYKEDPVIVSPDGEQWDFDHEEWIPNPA